MRAIGLAGSGLCLALLLGAPAARAALTAQELALDEAVLNQFNAVAFSDYTANNETEGRIAVGGDLTGSLNDNCFNGCGGNTSASVGGVTYGSLNVWGSVNGNVTSGAGNIYIQGNYGGGTMNVNGHGTVGIGGTNTGTINNAGAVNNTFPLPTTMPFQGALTDLASGIAQDATNDSGTVAAGAYVQNTASQISASKANGSYSGKNYGFITISASNLETYSNFEGIVTNGLDAVFVVVTGSGSITLSGMNSNNGDANVIWDFVDATSVTIDGQWFGQILAPDATVTNNGDLNGTVVADEIVQNAEIHQYDNGGDVLPLDTLSGLPTTSTSNSGTPVPEPSTIAVVLVGMLGIALARRRVTAV